MAEDICCNGGKRAPAVWHFRQRDLERTVRRGIVGCGGVSDDSSGAPRDGLFNVAIAVGRLATHGDEERAGRDATRIVLYACDGDVFADAPQYVGTRGALRQFAGQAGMVGNLTASCQSGGCGECLQSAPLR